MLLYDQVREISTRYVKKNFSEDLVGRLAVLDSFVVYELSAVAPFFKDWEVEQKKKIPKRAPGEIIWGEWRTDDKRLEPELSIQKTVAAGVVLADKAGVLERLHGTPRSPEESDEKARLMGAVRASDEVYAVRMFERLDSVGPDDGSKEWPTFRRLLNVPLVHNEGWIISLRDNFSEASFCIVDPIENDNHFGMPSLSHKALYPGEWKSPDFMPWVPLMAFALLHCKNVVAESVHPEERIQRECKKHGRPPRVTYKVLKIEVPKECHKRQTLDAADDGQPKVRFHLCSGHFKNLQHERFKNKGWHWWPAHWRGSKDLGRVEKSYSLKVAPPKKEEVKP